jgi:hypothetical protein
MSTTRFARIALITSMFIGLGATSSLAAKDGEVVVASGTLDGRFLADSLFHIGEFWMKVSPDTVFHRWLSEGLHKKVVILLTADPSRFADAKNVRILSGTLMHETAPPVTPATTNVVGRLPEGNSGATHILFLKDELTGTLGAVTFETTDLETAAKFHAYDDALVNIVIQIQ